MLYFILFICIYLYNYSENYNDIHIYMYMFSKILHTHIYVLYGKNHGGFPKLK